MAGQPTVTTFVIVLPIDASDIAVQVATRATLVSQDERPLLGGTGLDGERPSGLLQNPD